MTKKVRSTLDTFFELLSSEERKQFDEEYRELVLSELVLAALAKDIISVKKLAKIAGIYLSEIPVSRKK
jgi:hypothetical protein